MRNEGELRQAGLVKREAASSAVCRVSCVVRRCWQESIREERK